MGGTFINIKSSQYFDPKVVRRAMGRVTAAALRYAGAYIRKAAQHSIRRRKRISRPGDPPSSHTGSLKGLILYGYDPAVPSVVIGPRKAGEGEAPALLEFGGVVTRRRRQRYGRRRAGSPRTMHYRPRPFMGPAMERSLPHAMEWWEKASAKFGD